MSNDIPTELDAMQAAEITQLLRESSRRLWEAGDGAANAEDCLRLAKRIEAALTTLGVDRD